MSAKPKSYPLVLETLHELDSYSTCTYYSKGHHDKAAFVALVRDESEVDYPVERVQHEWHGWRIMAGPDGPTRCLCPAKQGTRGTFPVTILEL